MTFRRGASLPVASTLGHADSCDLGPTAGNGFYKRWPDDLALLSDLGLTDLRLTFDWARLQPKPGEFSEAWVERYENVFGAAEAIGLSVWGALHDDGVPKWFSNEGGLDDDEALTRWWPRWAERVADRFGDHVHGWLPFDVSPGGLPSQVWTDTWSVLGGGDAPVVLSVSAESGLDAAASRAGEFDLLGVALDTPFDRGADLDDDAIDELGERWEQAANDAAAASSDAGLIVSRFVADHADPDVAGKLVERLVAVLDAVIDDGINIETCLVEPAIEGPDSPIGLVAQDRTNRPAAAAYLEPTDTQED